MIFRKVIIMIIVLVFSLIYTPVLWLVSLILKILGLSATANSIIYSSGKRFARLVFICLGSKIEVKGLENIPFNEKVCVYSNHQSMFDIPLLVGYLPLNAGFIAKRTLGKIPILNIWLNNLNCLLINRKNAREAKKTINTGIARIKNKKPLIIFPEGTRSRSNKLGRFKKGSLKLAMQAESKIIPVTLNNTYKMYEENKKIKSSNITLFIHKPISTLDYNRDNRDELLNLLYNKIASKLEN